MDFRNSGGHENETYGIDVLFGKFKKLGYYTLLQEDSCWYDSWGSLFTDNTYQGNKPRYKHDFANRWKTFREKVANYNIDDFGLSHASCEILKRYNTTNQFNYPKKVCFRGKPFAEYVLDYAQNIYGNLKAVGDKTRLLTYTHLNTGHEVTGTRIRQIDERLSKYIDNMSGSQNTLTMVLSDHGPKTTKYSFYTMEGKAEKYDPFLFIVIPEKVANTLGLEKVRALAHNQNRLITTLDLHNAFMSLGAKGKTFTTEDKGIFGLIPANRTCADLTMKPLAVCKCEGWETTFPDNDKRFTWLAEFALGSINNQIQKQYSKGSEEVAGYGNCQRLVGSSFTKIRRRSQGGNFITTMDITVTPGHEIFESCAKDKSSGVKIELSKEIAFSMIKSVLLTTMKEHSKMKRKQKSQCTKAKLNMTNKARTLPIKELLKACKYLTVNKLSCLLQQHFVQKTNMATCRLPGQRFNLRERSPRTKGGQL
ncbi:hypothetical protein OS493_032331 [Desmophyllum pertusum]|uniref:Uncharacterized protein n=1 Tax=Desmophyllum pertusum TaxID=174260 RepID=A0A9W9YVX7_9CNID|nr:hypothetical protein OS493_032331 [Desmophyllum pertusum]